MLFVLEPAVGERQDFMKRSTFTIAVVCVGLAATMAKDMFINTVFAGDSYSSEYTDISSIVLDIKSADVIFSTGSGSEGVRVDVNDALNEIEMSGDGGVLRIEERSRKKGFLDVIGLSPKKKSTEIYITVPQDAGYEHIGVKMSSGSLRHLGGISANKLNMSVGSGSIVLDEMKVNESVQFDISSGKLSINDCAIGDSLNGKIGSGSISAEELDIGGGMDIKVSSGNIAGDRISVKGSAVMDLGSGNVNIDDLSPGSSTKIEASSGNIAIDLEGSEDDYSISAKTGSGKVSLFDDITGRECNTGSGGKHIEIKGGSGNISVIV